MCVPVGGWERYPEVEWYKPYDCAACGTHTYLEGLAVKLNIWVILIPLPLKRDWMLRCHRCRRVWKTTRANWKQQRQGSLTAHQMYDQYRAVVRERRAQIPAAMEPSVRRFERKGWASIQSSKTVRVGSYCSFSGGLCIRPIACTSSFRQTAALSIRPSGGKTERRGLDLTAARVGRAASRGSGDDSGGRCK